MDKYDNLLNEIIEKTKDGTMVWEIENPSSYESIVFQSGFAASAYSSSLSKNKKKFTVLFVEKHMPQLGGDWDEIAQEYYPELYFLTTNGVAFILDQRYVEIEDLSILGELIKESNEDSKSLFEVAQPGA